MVSISLCVGGSIKSLDIFRRLDAGGHTNYVNILLLEMDGRGEPERGGLRKRGTIAL